MPQVAFIDIMKKLILSFFFAFFIAFPSALSADPGDFSLGLSYAPVSLQGDYKKSFDKSLPGTEISTAAYRISLETEISNKLSLGLDFAYLGKNKYYESSDYWYEENSRSIGMYGRYDLLRFNMGKSVRFNMYGKGGMGYYMRNFDYHEGTEEDALTAGSVGYFYSAGIDFTLWNFLIIGADYRYDKTLKKFDASGETLSFVNPKYEAYSFGINIGIRFGDAAGEDILLEDEYGEKRIPLSQFGVSPVRIEKKDAARGIKAFNNNLGGSVELDRERYIAKADAIIKHLKDGTFKGDVGIPSLGVLFKIGKGDVLKYYQDMLDYFAELYLQTDQTSIVIVEGYSSEGILGLSRRRGREVATYLSDKGIPRKNIRIRFFGNTKTRSGKFDKDIGCKGKGCYRRASVMIE